MGLAGGVVVTQRWGVELAVLVVFGAALVIAAVSLRGQEPKAGPRPRVLISGLLAGAGAVAFVAAWLGTSSDSVDAATRAAPAPTATAVPATSVPTVVVAPPV